MTDEQEEATAGIADAIAFDVDGAPRAVVDWKSDVAPAPSGERLDLIGDTPWRVPVVVEMRGDVAPRHLAGEVELGAERDLFRQALIADRRVGRNQIVDRVVAVVENDELAVFVGRRWQ